MKLVNLLIFSFVLIALASFSLYGTTQGIYSGQQPKGDKFDPIGYKEMTRRVVVPKISDGVIFPVVSAKSVLAYDMESRVDLYEKNSVMPISPASTTKIMTALVAMDAYPVDEVLTVGKVDIEGQKMKLVYGEKISVRNLLYGLLVASGNDAAEVLAQNYPQGREGFIEAMNLKIKELGLKSTSFDNPSGLDGNGHVTTARDLVRISGVAMERDLFREIVGTKKITLKSEDEKVVHNLVNINELVGEVEGVLGVKTGWTEEAQENLVTYIEREGRKIMIAVMGSQDRFGETRELIDWIFENYRWDEVEVAI